jgi:hypothetical protein
LLTDLTLPILNWGNTGERVKSSDEPFDIMRFLHGACLAIPPAWYLYSSEAPFYWFFFVFAVWYIVIAIDLGIDHNIGKLNDLSYSVGQLEEKLERMEYTLNEISDNQ